MHSIQHYRERAAQARRLAKGITDRQLLEQLTALASQYEAIADRLEQLGDEQSPTTVPATD